MIKEFDWKLLSTEAPSKGLLTKISKSFKLDRIASQALIRRGLKDYTSIKKYLHGKYEDLYDPYLFQDMLKAVSRIMYARNHKEKVLIHGDYDVDGITSAAMLKMTFENLGMANVFPFVPTRSMGYGLSKKMVEFAINQKYTLLITCDCGSNEHKALRLAKKSGIDVIVLDHHAYKKVPDVYAFINPERADYPFPSLCGAGVVFKLVQALNNEQKTYPESYLDMVALATIADSVPLIDENRILVKLGLKILSNTQNIGLIELLKACSFYQRKISTEVVGFIIAPKINAPGRISSPKLALDLLLTLDPKKAEYLAKRLVKLNKQRMEINHQIRDEAIEMVEKNHMNDRVLVLNNDKWLKGIIGIVASTMVEIYHKPTIIVSKGYGSARTVPEFPLIEPLAKCGDLLGRWGGHKMAAGLQVKKKNIQAFRERINEVAVGILPVKPKPSMTYDAKLKLRNISMDLIEDLEKFEPYGMGNPLPHFVIEDVRVARSNVTKDGQHLQLSVSQNKMLLSTIGFWMAKHKALFTDPAQKFDLLFNIERSRNNTEQLIVRDLKEVKLNW